MEKFKKFFSSNTARAALLCFGAAIAIPLFFAGQQQPVGGGKETGSLPAGSKTSANPFFKILDRVGGFYQNLLGLEKASPRKAADSGDTGGGISGQDGALHAFAWNIGGGVAGGPATSASRNYQGRAARDFVRMDGKEYEIMTDAQGNKVVIMENGPVSFNKLMAETMSREDFEAAKKAAPHLEDWQAAEAVTYAKHVGYPGGAPALLKSKEYKDFTRGGNTSLFEGGGLPGFGTGGPIPGSGGSSGFAGGAESGVSGGNGGSSGGYSGGGRGGSYGGPSSYGGKFAAAVGGRPGAKAGASNLNVAPAVGQGAMKREEAAGLFGEQTFVRDERKLEVKADDFADSASSTVMLEDKRDAATVLIGNDNVRGKMTEELLGKEEDFKGELVTRGKPERIDNPWLLPVLTKQDPVTPFSIYDANSNKLVNSDLGPWLEADTVYVTKKETMYTTTQDGSRHIPQTPIKLAVVNGLDADKNIISMGEDSFYYQFIYNLISNAKDKKGNPVKVAVTNLGKENINNIISTERIDASTLVVVSNEHYAEKLRNRGIPAVAFPDYMPTPENMKKAAEDIYTIMSVVLSRNANTYSKEDMLAKQAELREEITKTLQRLPSRKQPS